MSETLVVSFLFRGFTAIVAIFITWAVLRGLDRLNDFSFKTWLDSIEEKHPQALAVYLAARVLGASILVGLLFS